MFIDISEARLQRFVLLGPTAMFQWRWRIAAREYFQRNGPGSHRGAGGSDHDLAAWINDADQRQLVICTSVSEMAGVYFHLFTAVTAASTRTGFPPTGDPFLAVKS
jgi:hypothetical protein